MKNESPELFRVSPSTDLHDLLKMQIQQVLPDRENSGSIVYIFRVRMCLMNSLQLHNCAIHG